MLKGDRKHSEERPDSVVLFSHPSIEFLVSSSALPMHILIIDDNKFTTRIYRNALAELGYTVSIAYTVEEALPQLKTQKIDLLLLDLYLPKEDGISFLERRIKRKEFSDIPVVVISNVSEELVMRKAKELGVREYFVKVDLDLETFMDAVRRLCPLQKQPV